MSIKIKAPAAVTYPLTTLKKAIILCLAACKPVYLWGGVGFGKTSLFHQIADELERKMFLINLGTMEPTDVGGHPYPIRFGTEAFQRMILSWIHAEGLLPFITPEREDIPAILLADEVDRCPTQTQNAWMNLARERKINGHVLCPSVSVACTGNGTSDSGTTPITKAMATRGVHFYVQTSSPQALDSWDKWAEGRKLSQALRGFAKYRQSLVVGAEPTFTELQSANPRTLVDAWELMELCTTVPWGNEVVEPLVFGSVGQVTGREMIAFQRMFDGAPTAAQIMADPTSAPVPADVGVLWAVGRYLMDMAAGGNAGEDTKASTAFAEYILRWPEEAQADWMRTASTKLPTLVTTKAYKKWEKTHYSPA